MKAKSAEGGLLIRHDGSPLHGRMRLDGGKHAFAHTLACAALADEGQLTGVPDHVDARTLRTVLGMVFQDVAYRPENGVLTFAQPVRTGRITVGAELSVRSRSLFCLLPTLLTRADEVVVEAAPRGCDIGERPDEWYLRTLGEFGVQVVRVDGATRLSWQQRRPARITFAYPTMTGTVVAVAAAAAVPGTSTISHASVEPSCDELLGCLRAMGGDVIGALPDITVSGADRYRAVDWAVAADRIHAVTYLTAALLTRGKVTVEAATDLRIPRFVEFLRESGARVLDEGHALTAGFPASSDGRPAALRAVSLATGSEPLFSSDWGPFAVLLMALRSRGTAVVTDDVFANRWQFVENLRAHGLQGVSTRKGSVRGRAGVIAEVTGAFDGTLRGGAFGRCPDIRGTAALVLAALVADGPCIIADDFHLRRGYADLPAGLVALGARAVAPLNMEVNA
ncbi:hypothetical protein [Streptomyces sp. NPDC058252]|uniref:hypothetical protein n=1 Tax=Streptomyces sp. NPDC058252 TaxID=3346405 RepID=UPI0036DFC313